MHPSDPSLPSSCFPGWGVAIHSVLSLRKGVQALQIYYWSLTPSPPTPFFSTRKICEAKLFAENVVSLLSLLVNNSMISSEIFLCSSVEHFISGIGFICQGIWYPDTAYKTHRSSVKECLLIGFYTKMDFNSQPTWLSTIKTNFYSLGYKGNHCNNKGLIGMNRGITAKL